MQLFVIVINRPLDEANSWSIIIYLNTMRNKEYRPFGDIREVQESIDAFEGRLDGIKKAREQHVGRAALRHQIPPFRAKSLDWYNIFRSSEIVDDGRQNPEENTDTAGAIVFHAADLFIKRRHDVMLEQAITTDQTPVIQHVNIPETQPPEAIDQGPSAS